jgi:uncharacterized protein (UPF0147 family)
MDIPFEVIITVRQCTENKSSTKKDEERRRAVRILFIVRGAELVSSKKNFPLHERSAIPARISG